MQIRTKRVYQQPSRQDGARVLVDGIWPRGVRKEDARLDRWLRGIAPSRELRQWFGHDPAKWDEFRERYFQELDDNSEAVDELIKAAGDGRVTLVYAARDEQHNNAVALKEYLESREG